MAATIDESSLLSETEDLLASLDDTAFEKHPPRSVVDKKRAPPELTRSAELRLLRKAASELEAQLVLLRQRRRSSLLVRGKRLQMWQQLAERQHHMRRLTEAENRRLKAYVNDLLSGSSGGVLPVFPKQLQLDLEQAMMKRSPSPARSLQPLRASSDLASAFDALLNRLDAGFAQVADMFCESGLDTDLTEPRSFAEKRMRRLGQPCQYFQLADLRLSPFPWQCFGDATWRSNKEWHLRDGRTEHPVMDRSETTFAVQYRVAHKTLGEQHVVHYKFAMRRYMLADQMVLVLASQCDGENELAGASAHTVGVLGVHNVDLQSAADPETSPATVVRSCMHIFPASPARDDVAAEAKTRHLVRLMSSLFEDDVAFMRQRVDTLLLRTIRSNRSAQLLGGVAGGPTRITFRGADAVC